MKRIVLEKTRLSGLHGKGRLEVHSRSERGKGRRRDREGESESGRKTGRRYK